jgi:hypothetical protein
LGREFVTKFINVSENLEMVKTMPESQLKEYFQLTAIRTRNAIGEVLFSIFETGNQGEGIKTALFRRQVPKWFYDKLSTPNVFGNAEVSIKKLLFPPDATKSVALSLREALDDKMVRANWLVTRGSELILGLIRDVRFMTRFTFAGYNPADWTSPEMAKLENTRVTMHPVFFSSDHFLDPKISRKFMSSNAATGETPAAVLARVLYSMLKVANLEVSAFANDIIVQYFGLDGVRPDMNKSVYSVLKEKPGIEDLLARYMFDVGGETLNVKIQLFCADMKIINANEIKVLITSILSGAPLMTHPEYKSEYDSVINGPIMNKELVHITKAEESLFEVFKEAMLPKTKGPKDKRLGISLAPVHPEAKRFLDGFNADKKVRLARKSIEKWLKGMPTAMQVQAAEIAVAQLTDSSFESVGDASDHESEGDVDEEY